MAMQVEEMYLQKLETGQLHMYIFHIYTLVSYLDNPSEEVI